MAALDLFFSFLLLLIFFFIIPTRASCPHSSCPGGPTVRFPFRLRILQLRRCGYAGFDLSCNNETLQTTLSLTNSSGNNFIVQTIDYDLQTLIVNDPDNCLPKRFLDRSFDNPPDTTPFRIQSFQMYTFLKCSPQATSFPVTARNISCLSDENHTVFAMPSREYDNWLQSKAPSPSPSPSSSGPSCAVISGVRVPARATHEWGVFGDAIEGVALTWSTPDCSLCEAIGRDCGLNRDASQIVCSDPKAKTKGLPRSAKYGIIIGVGIPGFLCILGLASYVCGRISAYGRRNRPNMDLSTSASQQPAIVVVGLDGPTIESYPKTLLGESRRLPKPNDTTCSICLGEYQPNEELRTIPECNHYFHATCVDEWLKMNATCPVCRKSPEGSALITPSSSMSSSSTSLPSP
ncbi:RING-H2 finger protein ATL20-like [Prunus avium]|uniref:RING-type E3 ubiquitin transferase n=1 Tax=Prunus avium TaxID=42229 RepID=A0A6P5SP07_PRUAV|nr:RING-H2 finger protein ATL20-like [Prunus avium]